jgi:hypothetical protein
MTVGVGRVEGAHALPGLTLLQLDWRRARLQPRLLEPTVGIVDVLDEEADVRSGRGSVGA